MGMYIYFRAQHCQKYALYQKMLQIKVLHNSISYKKLIERIYLSPLGMELRGSKDFYL